MQACSYQIGPSYVLESVRYRPQIQPVSCLLGCLLRWNDVCDYMKRRVDPSHISTDYGIIGMAPNVYDVLDDVAEEFVAVERVLGMLKYLQIEREKRRVEGWIEGCIQGMILSSIRVKAEC